MFEFMHEYKNYWRVAKSKWTTTIWTDPRADSSLVLPRDTIVFVINKIKTEDNTILLSVLTPIGIFCCFRHSFESL